MSVKSTVETLSPTRVRLEIEVPFAEIEPTLKKAYREVAQQVNIPGFRRGKVPAAVIDQRIGRGAVLNEAVQEVVPQQLMAALQQHQVKSLGRPEVNNLEFDDGAPLKFTAEVDVRPEIELPDLSGISVTVDEIQISEEEIDEQVSGLRDRFATLKTMPRAAQQGDYVQLDLVATIDGQPVEGGTATNISHEVGGPQLMPGLDEKLVGMSAGDESSFVTPLVAGDHAGREADVAVTVRTVKEKELPPLDDDFAQLASEFDTLAELRSDVGERLGRVKQMEQLYQARDKALDELVDRSAVPAPEGVVRDEVEHRKTHLTEELERMGRSLDDYLALEGKTEQELDTDLAESASKGIRVQMVLDALAEAQEIQVSDEEFGQEVVARAQRAGMEPQQYYDQLVRSGAAAQVFGEVRRGKTLGRVIEQITITDTAGNPVDPEAVRRQAPDAAATPAEAG
jgi:trigger factor